MAENIPLINQGSGAYNTQTQVTPSIVPLSPFGQMAAEKRSVLDTIADVSGKAAAIAGILKAPSGTVSGTSYTASTGTPFSVFGFKSNGINPLWVAAGVALAAVFILKK